MAHRKKGVSKTTLLNKWSKAIRARDGNICCVCGANRYIQAHHILPKKFFPEYMLEMENGI